MLVWTAFWIIAGTAQSYLGAIFLILVIRDFFTDNFKGFLFFSQRLAIAASPLAKVKTILEFVLIGLCFLAFIFKIGILIVIAEFVGCLAVSASLISGWNYARIFWKRFRDEQHKLSLIFLSAGLMGYHVKPKILWICAWSAAFAWVLGSTIGVPLAYIANGTLVLMVVLFIFAKKTCRQSGHKLFLHR